MADTALGVRSKAAPGDAFRQAVLDGLSRPVKSIPPRFLYDDAGCVLFDEITCLEAYYPTRVERELLGRHSKEVGDIVGPGATVVEFGAGSGLKIRRLLDAMSSPAVYVPIDIAEAALTLLQSGPVAGVPGLEIVPIVADFLGPLQLDFIDCAAPRLGFFPGSTIGNLSPEEARGFLERVSRLLGRGALFLVGVDTRKDEALLLRAYDDPEGVTAAFNLNLLRRANRELGADFALDAFAHEVRWNRAQSRIEMHARSLRQQTVHVAGHAFAFARGETIHTENSYKYSLSGFRDLASAAGWSALRSWTDADALFSLHLLRN
jgi:L-histidine N-alpha-methyltransferase